MMGDMVWESMVFVIDLVGLEDNWWMDNGKERLIELVVINKLFFVLS